MTFLEYVAERLMGPPTRSVGGRSFWNCPFHHDQTPSFCTLPSKPGFKDRYRCFGCGAWGDEFDLMKLFFDRENYGDRLVRIRAWRAEHEAESPLLFRGDRGVPKKATTNSGNSESVDDPMSVGECWANIRQDLEDSGIGEVEALEFLESVQDHCRSVNVSWDALIAYWRNFYDWIEETDQRHLDECDDPECDTIVCRAARGLPPLTKEELCR